MGKARLEPQIMEEINYFTSYFIDPNLGKPISVSRSLQLASSNLIGQMVFGSRLPYDDPTANDVVDALTGTFKLLSVLGMLSNVPFAHYFTKSMVKKMNYYAYEVIVPFCHRYIVDHKATFEASHLRDVMDQFILRGKKAQTEDKHCFSGERLS